MNVNIILCVGGGKTHLVQHLLNEFHGVWKKGSVFWLTTELSWNSNRDKLKDIIDDKCVFVKEEYQDLTTLLQRILKTSQEHKTREMSSLVVVDDLMQDLYNGTIGNELMTLMTQGRHVYVSVWILTQGLIKSTQIGLVCFCLSCVIHTNHFHYSPAIRSNFRATVVIGTSFNNRLKEYCNAPKGCEDVLKEQYQACVFVDNTMFKYKAPQVVNDKGRLGRSEYRGYLVKEPEEEPEEEPDYPHSDYSASSSSSDDDDNDFPRVPTIKPAMRNLERRLKNLKRPLDDYVVPEHNKRTRQCAMKIAEKMVPKIIEDMVYKVVRTRCGRWRKVQGNYVMHYTMDEREYIHKYQRKRYDEYYKNKKVDYSFYNLK